MGLNDIVFQGIGYKEDRYVFAVCRFLCVVVAILSALLVLIFREVNVATDQDNRPHFTGCPPCKSEICQIKARP
jgi:hypothetical protein